VKPGVEKGWSEEGSRGREKQGEKQKSREEGQVEKMDAHQEGPKFRRGG
jgi:hypothetical protein